MNRLLPVSVNNSIILFEKSIYKISAGGYDEYGYNCVIYISSFTCFLISYNDSNICSGNGFFFLKK
jgi:hypothetical protein